MSNILSQEEIDALLGGLTGGSVATANGGKKGEEGDAEVIPFNFVNQDRIVRGGMPTLEVIHDRFSRLMRTGLTQAIRRGVDVQIIHQSEQKMGEFMRRVKPPSSMHVLKMDPLRGYGLLVLPGKLIYTLIDIFFGGTGHDAERTEARDFTLIEQRIIRNLIELFERHMTDAWKPVYPLKVVPGPTETNPQFINIAQNSDPAFVVDFEIIIDEITTTLSVCLPLATIDPIKETLKGTIVSESLETENTWSKLMTEQIQESHVEVRAMLGGAAITIRDLLSLKEGDIVQLREDYEHPVEVLVEGVRKFWGQVGSHKCARAVQVTGINLEGRKKIHV